ncbi:unnamed protein product [Ranitomeya imitator]|uniref:Uncharacterized protein n=1 Tax=Ranitomeya imitator TaxID=111125 RepID=A0ABN9L013_9NEOB|nr:unnamed protein product [Ranitomeya imitator]
MYVYCSDIYRAILRLQNMSSDATMSSYSYETLKVTTPADHIYHVEINRPEKRNAMNKAFWREMVLCFQALGEDSNCRAVVISGSGKMFTSGIDLMNLESDFIQSPGEDAARIAWGVRKKIIEYQKSFSVIEKCTKPVIAAVHNGCIGGGVDLVTACDIRYCSQDAYFQVKEVDMGLAADVGTLQRLPNIIGNRRKFLQEFLTCAHSLRQNLIFLTGKKLRQKRKFRFFKVATFCLDDCFANSWHSLDELQEVVTGNGLPTILKEFPEMLSTCWPFCLHSAVQLTPNHLDWVQAASSFQQRTLAGD